MDLDQLFQSKPKPPEAKSGVSWEEWSWKAADRFLDDYRRRKNLPPVPADRRARTLALRLESLEKSCPTLSPLTTEEDL